jgi:hypothetical protein
LIVKVNEELMPLPMRKPKAPGYWLFSTGFSIIWLSSAM